MRIVFLSSDFKPNTGGIAELSHRICEGLAERGHDVHVLTIGVPDAGGRNTGSTYHVEPIVQDKTGDQYTLVGRRRARRRLLAGIGSIAPDVILAGNYDPVLWPLTLSVQLAPYCIFAHGGDIAGIMSSPRLWRRTAARRVYCGAERVFCNSRNTASLLTTLLGISGDRAVVTGAGATQTDAAMSRASARHALGWPPGPVILTVARLVPHKGVDTVLRALPRVILTHPDCRYVIIGAGRSRPDLEHLALKLELVEHVHFMGQVDALTKLQSYFASDLFVLVSRTGRRGAVEGFGIAFLEANAHGLAVIGSQSGGIPDAVEHGINGVLVKPDDPEELADAINLVLGNADMRETLAEAGRRRIAERFNWPSISARVERELRLVMQATSARDQSSGVVGK